MDEWIKTFAALGGFSGFAALVAVVYGWYSKRAEGRKITADAEKTKAETMGVVVDGAGDLVEHYRKLVGEMNTQMGELRKTQEEHTRQIRRLNRIVARFGQRVAYLTGGINLLVDQIQCLGEKPVWTPSDWSPEDEEPGHETPMPPVS